MMETFVPIMCTPFLLARKKSILDKADAELAGLYRSDKAHSFANVIEEKVDAGIETNTDDKISNNIRSNNMNPNNKRNRNGKQKNFNGESGTTPETNALGADKRKNHRKGLQKRKKTTRQEVKFSSNTAPAQPYARNNKNKTPTPGESGGKHRFEKGGKKNHQHQSRSQKKKKKNRNNRDRNGAGGGK